jgi:hypothetical protein
MHILIEQLAKDTGITIDKGNYFLNEILSQLIKKIPALQEVLEDVVGDAKDSQLKVHINKLIKQLQEQDYKEKFGTWNIPDRNDFTHLEGTSELF